MPALEGSAARIVGKRALRHFVVAAGHFDGRAGFQIIESEIHCAAAIVAGALGGIGDEDFSFRGSGVPEDFCDVPGTIAVVDEKTVAEELKLVKNAEDGFGGGALQECAGLRIDGRSEEIVGSGVSNVEMDCRVKCGKFDKVRLTKLTCFARGSCGESLGAKFLYRVDGFDAEEGR